MFVSVDNSRLRSNFTKDLQAIESAENFINLALGRLEINSLDELEHGVKEKPSHRPVTVTDDAGTAWKLQKQFYRQAAIYTARELNGKAKT